MRCNYKNNVSLYLDEKNNQVIIKKCPLKNFVDSYLYKCSVEDFQKIDLNQLFYTLSFKKDNFQTPKDSWKNACGGNDSVCEYGDIHVVQVNFLMGCNARCTFCCQKGTTKSQLSKDLYFQTLYRLKNTNIKALIFSDKGEPLLYLQEVKDFLKSLKKGDFEIIRLITNGHNIDDEFIDICNNSEVPIDISISVNAGTKETRKNIMGLDDFDELIEKINKLKNVVLSYVVTPENENEVPIFKNLFKDRWLNIFPVSSFQ